MDFTFFGLEKYWAAWSILLLYLLFRLVMKVSKKKPEDSRAIYPEEGKETEADVKRLIKSGDKIMAIKCYRAIHDVGLKEAKEQVDMLEIQLKTRGGSGEGV